MVEKNDISYLLINPPLTDPTVPYHSISYLIGSSSNSGYTNYSCLDANIESFNFLINEIQVDSLITYCNDLLVELEKKTRLTRGEQILYRYAIKSIGLTGSSVMEAIKIIKNCDKFYNYSDYRHAVTIIKRWLDVLSVKGFPAQFDSFQLNMKGIGNLSSISDLTRDDFLMKLLGPFLPYFYGPFVKKIKQQWNLIGLSVNYISQLPFAIFIAKLIKFLNPTCILCAGGTEITDCVKYTKDKQLLWKLFANFDVLVMGEGETAFVKILDSIFKKEPLPNVQPGVLVKNDPIVFNEFNLELHVNYEDLSKIADPEYDIWQWDQYWSPEPVILYSPTRGCYWNQCTFCDYGLNTTSPTSPSRQRSIESIIEELKKIRKIGRVVYFAVDAISPVYLKKISQAIIENHIDIRWSAELRLERMFKTDMVQNMKKAGCVCISFGYESGSQRVLNLINKGVNLEDVPDLLHNLSSLEIGSQMMGFIGFPSETNQEALATFQFLKDNENYCTTKAIGDFGLTSGSIVAKNYKKFGIERISSFEGDDIVRIMYWISNGKIRTQGDSRSESINKISESLSLAPDDRPFVGGVDSSHTILYFERYGKDLIPYHMIDSKPTQTILNTSYYVSTFNNISDFIDKNDLKNYHSEKESEGKAVNYDQMLNWLSEYNDDLTHKTDTDIEIFPNGLFRPCVKKMEEEASYAYKSIKETLLRARGYI